MSTWQQRRSGADPTRPNDPREFAERDRARLVHSSGFRRLQAKTQVLGVGDNDFPRTRLTHSMEVAQIAQGILGHLNDDGTAKDVRPHLPSLYLIEAISFAHDIGHPPFGHGGEIALNFQMRDHGGFEGNGQSLRQLCRLESHTPEYGLDLTRRTLLGILKYPVPYSKVRRPVPPSAPNVTTVPPKDEWKPPKCYLDSEQEIVDWILAPLRDDDTKKFLSLDQKPDEDSHGRAKHKSLDCSLMDIGDDIAYGVHDLEDCIALGLIDSSDWERVSESVDRTWLKERSGKTLSEIREGLFGSPTPTKDDIIYRGAHRKRTIGALVNALITSTKPVKRDFKDPLLAWRIQLSDPAKAFVSALKDLVYKVVISTQPVQSVEYKGQAIISRLFEAISSDPKRLLPSEFRNRWLHSEDKVDGRRRVVADYVAGMTDSYAEQIYQRLLHPGYGSAIDRV